MVIATIIRTDSPPPHQAEPRPDGPSLPMTSSYQPRRYRLVDHHGQRHLEIDEHFDSNEEAWAFATHW